jgi:hypothetical protein
MIPMERLLIRSRGGDVLSSASILQIDLRVIELRKVTSKTHYLIIEESSE